MPQFLLFHASHVLLSQRREHHLLRLQKLTADARDALSYYSGSGLA